MSFTDLITIAIPCYERKEYFLFALESALNQTVKCEIIVVDNHSTHDNFRNVCEERKITYYRNETNIGLYPNYNKCYSLATTKYVKILDDDDLLLPTYVESFLNALGRHPDIDVFYTDYLVLSSKGISNHNNTFPFGYLKPGDKIIENGAKYNLGFPYLTATIRKSMAQLDLDNYLCVGGYDWVWIYSKADKLTFFGESGKLYHYRMHGNKSSRGNDWTVNLLTYSYVFETIILKKLSETRLKKKISRKILWNLIDVKAQGNKNVLNEIMNSDNRFGNYFKTKLNDEQKLKIILALPKNILTLVYLAKRAVRKIEALTLKLK